MSRNRLYTKVSRVSVGALAVSVTVLALTGQPSAQAAPAQTGHAAAASHPSTAPASTVLPRRTSNQAATLVHLPRADLDARVKALLAKHHVRLPSNPLTDPTSTCDTNTTAQRWVQGQMKGLSAFDQVMLQATGATLLPTVDAIIAPSGSSTTRVTDHAAVLQSSLATLHAFWASDQARTAELVEMHDGMVTDPQRVMAVYRALGMSNTQARVYTIAEVAWARHSAGLQHGRNPLLTFNSVASDGSDGHRRIVMGQGIMAAMDGMGDGSLAARMVLAHEYGHEVQFSIGMTTTDGTEPTPALASERVELHADASAGYVAAHVRGYHLDTAALKQGNAMFYSLGDCSTDAADHHGSPAQRDRAVSWGEAQAAGSSTVLTPVAFRSIFDKALPLTIIPDTAA